MSKYLKSFEEHSEYATYISRDDRILPNVSLCEEENELHYNPFKPIIAKFNVTDTSSSIRIATTNASILRQNVTKITIDGIELSELVSYYTFDTIGEHIVKYSLVNPSSISYGLFRDCTSISSLILPDTFTRIPNELCQSCSNMVSITIPDSITVLGDYSLRYCGKLTNVILPKKIIIYWWCYVSK